MPIHYSIPGVELYLMSPGLPNAFKGPTINGSEQCYIIDNFGQTVNQSIATDQVSINLQAINWHAPTEIKCHHELLPGLYTRILLDKRIVESIRGVGPVRLEDGQFFSLIGSSFTSAVLPEESGEYKSLGLWWSANFIRDIITDDIQLRKQLNFVIEGFPAKLTAPPLALTEEMRNVLDELLGFDYTGPGVNKFLYEKMKKLARLIIKESTNLLAIKEKFTQTAWERLVSAVEIINTDPLKDITAEMLGSKTGLSPTLLRKGIKAITGYSFSEYCRNTMFIYAGRKILLDKERIKNISKEAGYAWGSDFGKGFKTIFWCKPIEVRLNKKELKVNDDYVMSIGDKFKYGSIIARYMSERETVEDLGELNKWLAINDNHLHLFGQLLDDTKTAWTKQWFDAAGVKHDKIRWTKNGGWYRYDLSRDEQIEFYKYAALMAISFIIYYFYLKL